MAHDHNHSNGHSHHGHSHSVNLTSVNTAFIVGIALNFLFVVIEVIVGLSIHSLSLLSDAGHNLADVASLGLSLLALRMSKLKSNDLYTYGYKKTTILVTFFNACLLLVSIGAIAYAAFNRFFHPEPLPGKIIAAVAAIGIVINTVTALMFLRDKDSDMNIRSAYLHLMSDAVVSVGLVIGGIIIFYTGFYWIDPVLSIIIAAIILLGTWELMKDSLKLSLDGVPEGIQLDELKTAAKKINGVSDIHHIHVWAMSTTENALTAHLVVAENTSNSQVEIIKDKLKHSFEHLNIQHATLETEFEGSVCEKPAC
jgi:cobalt-zinc-cadmium efflux system protein